MGQICLKLVILVLGRMAIVADLYSSLEGYREWKSDGEIEREDQKDARRSC